MKLNIKRCMPYEGRKDYSTKINDDKQRVLNEAALPVEGLKVESSPYEDEEVEIEEEVPPVAEILYIDYMEPHKCNLPHGCPPTIILLIFT